MMKSAAKSPAERITNALSKWLKITANSDLRGGLALPRNKPSLSTGVSTGVSTGEGANASSGGDIKTLSLPDSICIPLLNYQQEVLDPVASIGQKVRPGDLLAPCIIASCHGVIESIEPRAINHPSGISALCVIISPDANKPKNVILHPPQEFVTAERISACAVHGLGGAGFKTADKLNAICDSKYDFVDTLIINAVECEPLISCDESLIANQAPLIITAIEGLIELTQCRRCILAIEDDKTEAIEQLELAIQGYAQDVRFETVYLASVYPSGAERPLVERLTGKKTHGKIFPASLGILCINVATALATEHARQGHAMVSRIVTIAGELCQHPMNVRVTFGTSVYDVIEQTGNLSNLDSVCVRVGGPLSGFVIQNLSAPITATTNCITLDRLVEPKPIQPCIRCGACSDVCPVDLLPQQLHTYCINENTEKAKLFSLSECIECACCDIVCPSNIPLTQTFRYAKGLIREQDRQTILATQAESRYQQREKRLEVRLEKRALKRELARARLASSKDPIADALARAKQRRKKSADD
jgi:electron transport complex protein RnfC